MCKQPLQANLSPSRLNLTWELNANPEIKGTTSLSLQHINPDFRKAGKRISRGWALILPRGNRVRGLRGPAARAPLLLPFPLPDRRSATPQPKAPRRAWLFDAVATETARGLLGSRGSAGGSACDPMRRREGSGRDGQSSPEEEAAIVRQTMRHLILLHQVTATGPKTLSLPVAPSASRSQASQWRSTRYFRFPIVVFTSLCGPARPPWAPDEGSVGPGGNSRWVERAEMAWGKEVCVWRIRSYVFCAPLPYPACICWANNVISSR